MISQSDGSQRNPGKEFLTGYAAEVEKAIVDLQRERQLAPGEAALTGKVGQTIKDRYGTEITV
jgi:hypothetical protein